MINPNQKQWKLCQMNDEKPKPKAIQIRLPREVEDSLRFVATKTKRTLTSVVIDCLRDHLPHVSSIDFTLLDSSTGHKVTSEEVRAAANERLINYQDAVQLLLGTALQLTASLNAQVASARAMQTDLRRGHSVRVPEGKDGSIPDMRTANGKLSANYLTYLDASAVLQGETANRKLRKLMARHQFDAAALWENIRELLQVLDRGRNAS